jgi:hypothetical protein
MVARKKGEGQDPEILIADQMHPAKLSSRLEVFERLRVAPDGSELPLAERIAKRQRSR